MYIIENHAQHIAARIERDAKIEAMWERRKLYLIVIKLNVGIISILCAVYAVFMQF